MRSAMNSHWYLGNITHLVLLAEILGFRLISLLVPVSACENAGFWWNFCTLQVFPTLTSFPHNSQLSYATTQQNLGKMVTDAEVHDPKSHHIYAKCCSINAQK
jgi:hypothetical protein